MPMGKGTYGSKRGRPKKKELARTPKTNMRTQKPRTPKTMVYRKSRKR